MSVEVGSKAPEFTLPNQDGEPVSLGEQAGRNVVLAFFPAAFTSVCTKELCTFRDSLARLNDARAVVFGISVDSPADLKEFSRQQNLNFPLLSDAGKDAVTKYDVLNTDPRGQGKAKRAVFVIDGAGTIRYKEITANPGVEPDYERLFGALGGL